MFTHDVLTAVSSGLANGGKERRLDRVRALREEAYED
jgi:hypothetical protein